ncbi:MAG: ion transporter [Planctomycetes bacterium]|nr:ion transporter [Planctomycetota bacterium]
MTTERQKHVIVPHGTRLPPPRPGVRHVRVPKWRVVISDDELRNRVDRVFHWPMILLALAVLPLLIIEFIQKPEGWLDIAVRIGFAVIWLAFVVEFFIKIAIAESRVEYVRRNWLDVIIIILPLFRPLRLARTARVFKLRGVGMKVVRHLFTIVIGMEATNRVLERFGIKPGAGRRHPDDMTRHELTAELKVLRSRIDAWEAWHEAHDAHVDEHGGPCCPHPPPAGEPPAAAPPESPSS